MPSFPVASFVYPGHRAELVTHGRRFSAHSGAAAAGVFVSGRATRDESEPRAPRMPAVAIRRRILSERHYV
jgi:hypothetical protein